MSLLENAPDEVKLAVHLIVPLSENQLTGTNALEIVTMRDYENKLKVLRKTTRKQSNCPGLSSLSLTEWSLSSQATSAMGHETSTHHAARCGISTDADAKEVARDFLAGPICQKTSLQSWHLDSIEAKSGSYFAWYNLRSRYSDILYSCMPPNTAPLGGSHYALIEHQS